MVPGPRTASEGPGATVVAPPVAGSFHALWAQPADKTVSGVLERETSCCVELLRWGWHKVRAQAALPSRQMDDEDTLLPRKLQAALEQALERKNELISQDSDSDSEDGE